MENCDSHTALWAALTEDGLNEDRFNRNAILQEFGQLPDHLRRHLGPLLSKNLLSAMDFEGAEIVLRSAKRGSSTVPASVQLAEAMILIEEGDLDSASEPLASVIQGNSELSPLALATLIEEAFRTDQPISVEIAELAEAFAKEFDGSVQSERIKRAHVFSLALTGKWIDAFSSSMSSGAENEQIRNDATVSSLAKRLAREATDFDIADIATRFDLVSSLREYGDIRIEIARRVFEAGFLDLAEEFLRGTVDERFEQQRNLILAKIALKREEFDIAHEILGAMSGQKAMELRAEVRLLSGRPKEARVLFHELGEKVKAKNAAWAAQDWAFLTENGKGPVRDVAKALKQNKQRTTHRLSTLEAVETQLSEAEQTRKAFLRLIERTSEN
jgi:predicted negative regulator of RcsB-dependent stress response